jgi:oxygen-dependent protoporphyrinogen oxidase
LTLPEVIIIGAGITGLSAAYELRRRGIDAIVLEAATRPGGLIRTERAQGFTIEAGADSMLVQKPAALDLCRELGLERDLQGVRPPGGAFVLRGTRLYPLPRPSRFGIPLTWRALATYDLLPVGARLRMALEPLIGGGAPEDESVSSFFRRRFGSASVDLIAQPLLGGIHAGDIDQLSMRALFPGLIGSNLCQAPASGAGRSQQPGPDAGGAFRSLRGGMSTLIETLERSLPAGTVRYQSAAERLERISTGWRVAATGEAHDASAVIVAAPASVAAKLFTPIDGDMAGLCGAVPYVSTASVALAWPRAAIAHPLAGTGFVVARRHTPVRITACTWVSSKWEARAPEGSALLRVFAGGAHDPEVVDLNDDALVALARRDLGQVLGITAEPTLARVYRWRAAGPQYIVGHLARMRQLDERRARHSGLFVAGSGFRSIGIPDCVADARTVAAAAADFVRAAAVH